MWFGYSSLYIFFLILNTNNKLKLKKYVNNVKKIVLNHIRDRSSVGTKSNRINIYINIAAY